MEHLSYKSICTQYPLQETENLRTEILAQLHRQHIKIAVLDDDPTGIQTVHSCLLLTDWKAENIQKAFSDESPFFYLLTNTRALPAAQAKAITASATQAVLDGNKAFGYKLIFISRSDSTLRGHFPLETDVIRKTLNANKCPVWPSLFFVPAFLEVGRLTIQGVHYVRNADELIPVSETEFAHDNVFAYHHSRLKDYLSEKTGKMLSDKEYASFALDDFQQATSEERSRRCARLLSQEAYISVDALYYTHLQNFVLSLLQNPVYQHSGNAIIIRSSSSLPKAISGICDINLLEKKDFENEEKASRHLTLSSQGLFIVGSHVKKSSGQLKRLLDCEGIVGIEADVRRILENPKAYLPEIEEKIQAVKNGGNTPVVYTSRQEIRLENSDERLALGQKISQFIVSLVLQLPYQPAYLVAKGGITSHDILTQGLQVKTARVMGQVLSGVPAIQTGKDVPMSQLPYIIFPGNVGEEDSLVQVFQKFCAK